MRRLAGPAATEYSIPIVSPSYAERMLSSNGPIRAGRLASPPHYVSAARAPPIAASRIYEDGTTNDDVVYAEIDILTVMPSKS